MDITVYDKLYEAAERAIMSKGKDLRLNFTIDFDGMLKLSNNNKEWIGQLLNT